MKTVTSCLFLAILCTGTQAARADYLWTWHGNQNLFQGSFEVTDAEMLPGASFNSALFTNSISISSLDGLVFHATNSDTFASGSYGPRLSLNLVLSDQATLSRLSATVVPLQVSLIDEVSPFGHSTESGFWIGTYTPEPSPAALLTTGVLFWIFQRRRGDS